MSEVKQKVQTIKKFTFSTPSIQWDGEEVSVHLYLERSGVRIDRGRGTVLVPLELVQAVAECMLNQVVEVG